MGLRISYPELREWLGLTLADLYVYLATTAVIAMYFVDGILFDLVLGGLAIGFAGAACPLGMKFNPALSLVSNLIKIFVYPICACLVAAGVVAHFVWYAK